MGIVRKVDKLGRVVIPVELRRLLDVDLHDTVELQVEDDQLILRKEEPCCTFCRKKKRLLSYRKKWICQDCLQELNNQNDAQSV